MLEEFGSVKKDILDYLEVRIDLLKLQVTETLARVLTKAANIAIIGSLLFLILTFLSFSAGFYMAALLHSDELGFLCVAGFYTLLLIVFLFLRKHIIERPIIVGMVKLLFPKLSDDEEK